MNDDAIFLLDAANRLTVAPLTQHGSEADFQEMLERHPRLLAGARIRPEDPLRWLLVKREASVPDTDSGQGRWSLDHLFIDQDGTPTLVEVKRSSDTRLRREVVGQMFDYAANAQLHWSANLLRTFSVTTHGSAEAVDDAVAALLQLETDAAEEREQEISSWWDTVDDKLQRGVLRLLFVADSIPSELRRIIEFLNEQMQNIEVLGVELSLYADGVVRVLVPRVVGQTETAIAQKSRGSLKPSPRQKSVKEIIDTASADVARLMTWLADEAKARGLVVSSGSRGFNVRPKSGEVGVNYYLAPERADGDPAYADFFFPKEWGQERIDDERRRLARLDPNRLVLSGRYTVRVRLVDQAACDLVRTAIDGMLVGT